jgi:hypothetical protein
MQKPIYMSTELRTGELGWNMLKILLLFIIAI